MRFLRYLILAVVITALMGLSVSTTAAKPKPYRAIVTFDGTTPIYTENNGIGLGLWLTIVYPPTFTVNTER